MFFKKPIIFVGNIIIYLIGFLWNLISRYLKYIVRGVKNELKKVKKFLKSVKKIKLSKLLPHHTALMEFLSKDLIKKPKKKEKKKKKKRKKKVKKKKRKTKAEQIREGKIKMFLYGIAFVIFFIFAPYKIYSWFKELPNPELLMIRQPPQPTRILDKKGRLLYEIYVDRRYEPVTLDKIPQHVIDATLAVEDDDFYSHFGFDVKSMFRAAKETVLEDNLQGGSTITQQLIKNVLLTSERTVVRKTKEIVLSVLVEAMYTKEEILEMYLNNISYGGTAWGIQSASQKFFGKNVWEIDLAEAALLAGLPSAPSAYSPLGGDISIAKARQKHALDRMYELEMISRSGVNAAFEKKLEFAPQTEYIRAPHFVALVRNELEQRYGRRFVEFGGLTVKTTLDLDLHDKVQDIVGEEVEKNVGLLISNGAAVVLDARSAGILAYVGSVDYFRENWGAFDVASGYRQPGSSIKPVTYALAFREGYTPANTVEDKPITFRVAGSEPYTPKNYDGKHRGTVTLRTALSNSLNIPAVRLAAKLGPRNIVQLGKDLGLTNWDVDGSYGLSVTLGGEEVRLLDLTNVYGTFARGGEYKKVTPFVSIKDSQGYEIYKEEGEKKVISEEVAYLIWHILSDNNARVAAFGVNNSLVIPGKKVAAKTGTTDQIRDNYTLGFTPSYVVGVWVGNNDNTPLHRYLASGVTGAAPMWNRITNEVLKNEPNEEMERPDGIFAKYDEECGRSEVFIKGSKVPATLCPKDEDEDDDKDDDDKDKD
ncbi:transglycosylase domain-containing protein [Patescibacteria group bacterium]